MSAVRASMATRSSRGLSDASEADVLESAFDGHATGRLCSDGLGCAQDGVADLLRRLGDEERSPHGYRLERETLPEQRRIPAALRLGHLNVGLEIGNLDRGHGTPLSWVNRCVQSIQSIRNRQANSTHRAKINSARLLRPALGGLLLGLVLCDQGVKL